MNDIKKKVFQIVKNLQKYAIENKCVFTQYNNKIYFEEYNFILKFEIFNKYIVCNSEVMTFKDFINFQSHFLS